MGISLMSISVPITPPSLSSGAVPTDKLDGAAWAFAVAYDQLTAMKSSTEIDEVNTRVDASGKTWVVLSYSVANVLGNTTVIATTARYTVPAGKTLYVVEHIQDKRAYAALLYGIRNITDTVDLYLINDFRSAAPWVNSAMKPSVAAAKQIAAQLRSNDAQARPMAEIIICEVE